MPLFCSTPNLLLGGIHLAFHVDLQLRFDRHLDVQLVPGCILATGRVYSHFCMLLHLRYGNQLYQSPQAKDLLWLSAMQELLTM